MKHKQLLFLVLITAIVLTSSSCSITNRSMKTPNYHIEFYKEDFKYSPQVSAEATSVRILGIDWNRLFKKEKGQIDSDRSSEGTHNVSVGANVIADPVVGSISSVIPVLGDLGKGKVSAYALHNLMKDNPGYDVVIYPQYIEKKLIIPIFYSKRTVKVTARLGKIK